MNYLKEYWSLFYQVNSRKSKSENRMLNDREFMELSQGERTIYVMAHGVRIGAFKEAGIVIMLFKCPRFYAEFEYSLKSGLALGWTCFTDGWKLDRYLELVKIDTLGFQ